MMHITTKLPPCNQVVHFSTGKEAACQIMGEDFLWTDDFPIVTCPECLNIVRASGGCIDCGMAYSDFPLDLLLPRGQWLLVNPQDDGLLCPLCMLKRAAKIPGATVVHAVIEITPR